MMLGVSSYSFSKYMRDTGANYFTVCDPVSYTHLKTFSDMVGQEAIVKTLRNQVCLLYTSRCV